MEIVFTSPNRLKLISTLSLYLSHRHIHSLSAVYRSTIVFKRDVRREEEEEEEEEEDCDELFDLLRRYR